ncbi:MAG: protein TolR [bacterium]|nr:protein TolR [bacterium]
MASNITRGSRLSDINVTPLVDVMLVLLIIFMVTAPLLQQAVHVDLPKVTAEGADPTEDAIIVTVDKGRKIYINDREIRASDLRTKLTAIFQGRQKKEVFLRADRDVPYGEVVKAMAAIRASGIKKLNMVTDPLEDSPRQKRRRTGRR